MENVNAENWTEMEFLRLGFHIRPYDISVFKKEKKSYNHYNNSISDVMVGDIPSFKNGDKRPVLYDSTMSVMKFTRTNSGIAI